MTDQPTKGQNAGVVVVLMASRMDDEKRVREVLRRANYRTLNVEFGSAVSAIADTAIATVVCHRKSLGFPVPKVPEQVPGHRVLVISDCQSEKAVVDALEAGAHHYFNIDESPALLQVRIEAALRHHFRPSQRELQVEPFTFDLEKREVRCHGQLVDLSPKEYEFAYYLFTHRGRVVRNDELMTSVWSLPRTMDTRRIDTAACRVRKKLLLSTGSGWALRRLRSVGYELRTLREETSI